MADVFVPLSGRVALVTGASRGIGRGIAVALASAGARVAVGYRVNGDRARAVVEQIQQAGGHAVCVGFDVADRDGVRAGIGAAEHALGPVDVLVNNAAVAQEKPFEDITDADWDRIMAVNLRGAFTCCQELLPGMVERRWGRIINISSIGGQWGGFNQVHYAAAKAGLISLTRSLARIYSGHGVTANAIAPGLVATDMTASELAGDAGQQKIRGIPAGRIGTVGEVAAAAVYLAGEGAAYVTGQTINVNGGMYFV